MYNFSIEHGKFKITSLPKYNNYLYVVVSLKIQLILIFKNGEHYIIISERTTITSLFCFLNFIIVSCCIIVSTNNKSLNLAYDMKNNFISDNAMISPVISTNPNGLETNSYPLFNYLSNLIYYTVVNTSYMKTFYY